MSVDSGNPRDSWTPQEQARYWDRKLDTLLRLEAEALAERLGIGRGAPEQAGAARGRVLDE